MIYEENEKLSKKNIQKINQGIYLYKNIIKIKINILNLYKSEILEFSIRNYGYCNRINLIGKFTYENKITDIYEISMLEKELNKESTNNTYNSFMFKNVNQAKKIWKKIIERKKIFEEFDFEDNNSNDYY